MQMYRFLFIIKKFIFFIEKFFHSNITPIFASNKIRKYEK